MSLVSFPANYAGSPPAPFSGFNAGAIVFYLVGLVQASSTRPLPGQQLSIFRDKVEGDGRSPVDTITETAKGWRGRNRVTVATRTYSYARYTRGAKAAAVAEAMWTAADGSPLTIWSHLVRVDDAQGMGYRTPQARTVARPGRRGVGLENNAAGTIAGRSVAVASVAPASVAPASVAPVAQTAADCGRLGTYGITRGRPCIRRARHSGTCRFGIDATVTASPEAALALLNGGAPVASVAPASVAPASAPAADRARTPDLTSDATPAPVDSDAFDPSVARFLLLDLS